MGNYRKYNDPHCIVESDWKILRKNEDELVNKFCQKVLDKIESLIKNENESPHEKYLKLFKLLDKEDKKISEMFDGLRRSNAIMKIISMKYYGLIDDEFIAQFTEETQNRLKF